MDHQPQIQALSTQIKDQLRYIQNQLEDDCLYGARHDASKLMEYSNRVNELIKQAILQKEAKVEAL